MNGIANRRLATYNRIMLDASVVELLWLVAGGAWGFLSMFIPTFVWYRPQPKLSWKQFRQRYPKQMARLAVYRGAVLAGLIVVALGMAFWDLTATYSRGPAFFLLIAIMVNMIGLVTGIFEVATGIYPHFGRGRSPEERLKFVLVGDQVQRVGTMRIGIAIALIAAAFLLVAQFRIA